MGPEQQTIADTSGGCAEKSASVDSAILRKLTVNLNAQQCEAVTTDFRGHILVLAGAGSGKTSVLTRRIAWLIAHGIEQDRILALTFSRKAAEEMSSRTSMFEVISKEKRLPLITTFHSFALKILHQKFGDQRNYQRIGFTNEPKLLDEKGSLTLLGNMTSVQEREFLGVDFFALDSLISQRIVFPEKITDLEKEKLALLDAIIKKIAIEKRVRGVWGFDDMINGTFNLLTNHNEIAKEIRSGFDAILVDEFQDTNPKQIALLKIILDDNKGLFAVGDDDQAIYGFRGADIRPITHFTQHFTDAKIIKLQINYRSVPGVLNVANKIFASKGTAYRKVLICGNENLRSYKKKSVFLKTSQNQETMIDWIFNKCNEISDKNKIPIDKMALLFRVHQSIDLCAKYWKRRFPLSLSPIIMTIHGSKGLEFPIVFLCDLEEGIFPHYRMKRQRKIGSWIGALQYLLKRKNNSKPAGSDLDEEQRLFYVGVTRAQQMLFLVSVKQKILYGRAWMMEKSRFLKLIK